MDVVASVTRACICMRTHTHRANVVRTLSAYIVPRNGINRGSSRSRRVKARLRAGSAARGRGGTYRGNEALVSLVSGVRLRYSGDGRSAGEAGRSNLSAAIIPDNYVKCKNSPSASESGESSIPGSMHPRTLPDSCKLLKNTRPLGFTLLEALTETCEFSRR